VVLAKYSSVSQVPYEVKCPFCGLVRRAHFVKCYRGENMKERSRLMVGLPMVFVTNVKSRLGQEVLFLVETGLIRSMENLG
jgi:hypothetical protein